MPVNLHGKNSVLLMALRMGVQLDVFKTIRDNQNHATTTQQIASESGASVVLVGRSPLSYQSPY